MNVQKCEKLWYFWNKCVWMILYTHPVEKVGN